LEWKKAEGTGFEKHKKKASKKRQILQIYRQMVFGSCFIGGICPLGA
jgi:hypothetical protein